MVTILAYFPACSRAHAAFARASKWALSCLEEYWRIHGHPRYTMGEWAHRVFTNSFTKLQNLHVNYRGMWVHIFEHDVFWNGIRMSLFVNQRRSQYGLKYFVDDHIVTYYMGIAEGKKYHMADYWNRHVNYAVDFIDKYMNVAFDKHFILAPHEVPLIIAKAGFTPPWTW